MVFKTTFGQSQMWSLVRCSLGVENEGLDNLNFANKVFNRQIVLILDGRNSGISLYFPQPWMLYMISILFASWNGGVKAIHHQAR